MQVTDRGTGTRGRGRTNKITSEEKGVMDGHLRGQEDGCWKESWGLVKWPLKGKGLLRCS